MKCFIKRLPLAFLILVFTSCDPVQELKFVNKTDSDATVRIILKPKAQNYYLEQAADKDSIVFKLQKDSTAAIYFGVGMWSGKDIYEFTNAAKRVEFETKNIKTMYKSEDAIGDILSDNVKGVLIKNVIEIEIKEK